MSYDTFTAILNASRFPFISDFFQRSVIIPGIDNPQRAPKSFYGTKESENLELAQQYYAQNVMPTAEGIMSVGYSQVIAAIVGATDFDQVITLRDPDENNFLFAPAGGMNYIYAADTGIWAANNSFGGWLGSLVTRSYVNGRTFIAYEKRNIYEYNTATGQFLPVVLAGNPPDGRTVVDIDGISNSNNYLLWWDNITIGWSSLVDPLDLTPSINTGAASAIPQDVKGPIRCIVPIAGGFVIYTTKNAVAALYTNNARAPFVFREIGNAGGVQSAEHVSVEASLSFHYAWTTNGLQKININSAESLSAAATDFLVGHIFESFNFTTNTLTVQKGIGHFKVKLTFISGRFLVISYGLVSTPQVYTHALVLDTSLERWGKLRIDHTDCFSYPYPNIIGQVVEVLPNHTMGFLSSSGTVTLMVMDYAPMQDQGVVLLGKYQLVRQKAVTFQFSEFENLTQAFPPNVFLILSDDGRNLGTPQQLTVLQESGNYKKYGISPPAVGAAAPRRTAKNFSLLVTGTFEFNTVTNTITRHGNR